MGWAPVKLGEHEYELVPQRIAYLDAKLGSLNELLDLDMGGDGASIVRALGDNAYRLLKVFIPDLMPDWEWRGYASEQLAAEDRYDEQADRSPTVQEIVTAFEGVMAVNKLDLFKHLGKLVGTEFLGSAARAAIANSVLPSSENSPSANGAPTPTASSMNDPTGSTGESSELTALAAS